MHRFRDIYLGKSRCVCVCGVFGFSTGFLCVCACVAVAFSFAVVRCSFYTNGCQHILQILLYAKRDIIPFVCSCAAKIMHLNALVKTRETTMHNIRVYCVQNFTFSNGADVVQRWLRSRRRQPKKRFYKNCDAVSHFGGKQELQNAKYSSQHSQHHRIINNGLVCNNNLNKSCLHFR